MKKISCLLFSLAMLFNIMGCSQGVTKENTEATSKQAPTASPISSSVPTVTATPTKDILSIDWNACIEFTKKDIMSNYDYVKDIAIILNQEEKNITFSVIVNDSLKPSLALDMADTVIRRFGGNAMMYGSSKGPSKDYYGEIYDAYSVLVGVAPLSKIKNLDDYFVYDTIAKGTHTLRQIKLNKKYRQ